MVKETITRGNASQFFVAGELCRRGYSAVVTLGNTQNIDILCSNLEGTKFVFIQVKTYRPGDSNCFVGKKSENDCGDNFFWVLGGIPKPDSKDGFEYYIIPSHDMSRNIVEAYNLWLKTLGKKGQIRNPTNMRTVQIPPLKSYNGWDISKYRERWDLIEAKLK